MTMVYYTHPTIEDIRAEEFNLLKKYNADPLEMIEVRKFSEALSILEVQTQMPIRSPSEGISILRRRGGSIVHRFEVMDASRCSMNTNDDSSTCTRENDIGNNESVGNSEVTSQQTSTDTKHTMSKICDAHNCSIVKTVPICTKKIEKRKQSTKYDLIHISAEKRLKSKNRVVKPFMRKLRRLFASVQATHPSAFGWVGADSKIFRLSNRDDAVVTAMAGVFKATNFNSLKRQLNNYGFFRMPSNTDEWRHDKWGGEDSSLDHFIELVHKQKEESTGEDDDSVALIKRMEPAFALVKDWIPAALVNRLSAMEEPPLTR
eukprot:CAMPEP_0185760996 /NCGR_PEP_ID=MMETSP1174-20130828/19897_1 /TAXON_ID=35687 /ORGANISM="Dictyocha speculum, Strain CCMP1381" /LENGTH=317 /DNA_ID=CAMNT_0028442029 /DNA_START=226 /DNA_END=1179 /DNA_ORIENTATION=-